MGVLSCKITLRPYLREKRPPDLLMRNGGIATAESTILIEEKPVVYDAHLLEHALTLKTAFNAIYQVVFQPLVFGCDEPLFILAPADRLRQFRQGMAHDVLGPAVMDFHVDRKR